MLKKRSKPLLIAEIGHNWVPFGWDSIKSLIADVKDAGWDIVKFQAYDTDKIKQPGDTNYEELKKAELSFDQLVEAKNVCEKYQIEFLASAFDVERIDWLEIIGVDRHKVASRSIHDASVVNKMLKTGKQVIISTAEWHDMDRPPKLLPRVDYLFCRSRRQILRNGFDTMPDFTKTYYSGFSDHTIGNDYAKLAMDLGAKIIEKHVTLDKNAPGWDQPSSADFNDMMEINNYREGF